MKNQKLLALALSVSLLFANATNVDVNNKVNIPEKPFNLEVYLKEEEKIKQLKRS